MLVIIYIWLDNYYKSIYKYNTIFYFSQNCESLLELDVTRLPDF